ncbi:hypothetical protein PPROV_000008800 [Pycnococcus provasolii]|uniref:Mitochondrial fission process protein 1 n=1 Tax=Pycnococcus provasolii TaxID=41880 RepID=A0A830H488_9CHLO|nr:hypothetical protein PPROV_000008800 [Pycnococcus provasolii]
MHDDDARVDVVDAPLPPLAAVCAVDVAAAVTSAAIIAPFITLVDKAVVQSAAGVATLSQALATSAKELITRPHVFVRRPEVALVAGVYASTYAAANLTDSICDRVYDEADTNSASKREVARFATTTATNMTASLLKDAAFAKLFGKAATGVAPPVPLACYALFATRDCATIASAFTVPRALAPVLSGAMGMPPSEAEEIIQVASPIASQIVCTPIHLLALDVYNRPDATKGLSRFATVAKQSASTTLARMGRMAPAYGLGGITNTYLTHKGHDYLHDVAQRKAEDALREETRRQAEEDARQGKGADKLRRTQSTVSPKKTITRKQSFTM